MGTPRVSLAAVQARAIMAIFVQWVKNISEWECLSFGLVDEMLLRVNNKCLLQFLFAFPSKNFEIFEMLKDKTLLHDSPYLFCMMTLATLSHIHGSKTVLVDR